MEVGYKAAYESGQGDWKIKKEKRKAAQPQMSFSLPFWTPKRKWGVGQSPTAAA